MRTCCSAYGPPTHQENEEAEAHRIMAPAARDLGIHALHKDQLLGLAPCGHGRGCGCTCSIDVGIVCGRKPILSKQSCAESNSLSSKAPESNGPW